MKKRKFDEITDRTEDEQLAIAIAASMKNKNIKIDENVGSQSDRKGNDILKRLLFYSPR